MEKGTLLGFIRDITLVGASYRWLYFTPHLAFGLKHGHYWLLYAKAAGVEVECSAGLEIFVIMNALPCVSPALDFN